MDIFIDYYDTDSDDWSGDDAKDFGDDGITELGHRTISQKKGYTGSGNKVAEEASLESEGEESNANNGHSLYSGSQIDRDLKYYSSNTGFSIGYRSPNSHTSGGPLSQFDMQKIQFGLPNRPKSPNIRVRDSKQMTGDVIVETEDSDEMKNAPFIVPAKNKQKSNP